jgi:hypothetical protein
MPTVKRIVCLANSRKTGGYCVAGKELEGDGPVRWIRPVSSRVQEEVSDFERRYEDGSTPQLLDLIDVPLLDPRPKGHQRENWLLDPTRRWKRVGSIQRDKLNQYVDPISPLWIDRDSTSRGLFDQVAANEVNELTQSLRLIDVQKVVLSVFDYYNKRRVQARFRFAERDYWLWVTDPLYEETFKAKPDGDYSIGQSWLTISLAEPFLKKNACYKLVAAIISKA